MTKLTSHKMVPCQCPRGIHAASPQNGSLSVCLSVLCRLFSHWDQESEVHTSYRTGTVRTSEEEDLHDKHSQTLIDLFNEYCSVSVLCPQAAI